MARYPGALWKPISKSRNVLSGPKIICIHTMVGSLRGTDAHFRRVGTDSHFGVGNPTDGADLDGAVWQWVDTARVAFANYHGNSDVISIETADGGNPNNPWSSKTLASLVKLIAWLCKTHNITAVLINGNQRGKVGLGYHRQGCDHSSSYRPRGWPYDQWRVANGVRWSSSLGKVCPGDVRIKQFVDTVIPRVKGTPKEDDMELTDKWDEKAINALPGTVGHALLNIKQNAKNAVDAVSAQMKYKLTDEPVERTPRQAWAYTHGHVVNARREIRAVTAAVAANGAALDALAKALAEHDGQLDPEAFARTVREASEAGAKAALESIPLAAVLVREDEEEES